MVVQVKISLGDWVKWEDDISLHLIYVILGHVKNSFYILNDLFFR